MSGCQHEDFEAMVEVARITDGPDEDVVGFAAEVTIVCAVCRRSMGFRGLTPGMPASEPGVTPDALTARLPLISPEELDTLGPLAAMQMPSGVAGFTMRIAGG
jgi:hypothetical protein